MGVVLDFTRQARPAPDDEAARDAAAETYGMEAANRMLAALTTSGHVRGPALTAMLDMVATALCARGWTAEEVATLAAHAAGGPTPRM